MSTLDSDDYVITPAVSPTAATSEPVTALAVQARAAKNFQHVPIIFNFPHGQKFFVPRAGLPAESKRLDEVYTRHLRSRGDRNFMPHIGLPCDWDNDLIADVTAQEFRSLLKLTCLFVLKEPEKLTVDDWMAVLKLAKLWDMPETHDKAVKSLDEEIQKRTAAGKIVLAKRFDVETWFKAGFAAFVSGKEQISTSERDELGWETYARLLEAKDKARSVESGDSGDTLFKEAFGSS